MTIADRIKKRRKDLELTQEDLANRMGLSDRSSVTRIEHSGNNVSFKQVSRIAPSLMCTPAYLLGMTDNPSEVIPLPSLPGQHFRIRPEYDSETGNMTYHKEEQDPITEEWRTVSQKTKQGKVPKGSVIIADEIAAVGSGRDIIPPKVTGVEVINRQKKPEESTRETLIKMLFDLTDSQVKEILKYAKAVKLRDEGGE